MGLLPFLLEMAAGAEEEGKLFKVIVCGEYACGKTSIISRYTSNTFSPNYKLTIGVDFTLKVLEHNGESVKLQLWDISGSERYGSMTRAYYKHCIAAVIVYDITREPTFEAVIKWKRDLDSVPNPDELDRYCAENGFIGWFATSAREDIGINDAFARLTDEILEVSAKNIPQDAPTGIVSLVGAETPASQRPGPGNGGAAGDHSDSSAKKCCA